MGMASYRVLAPCRVGGAFRRAGEIILLPRFDGETPLFLKEVSPEEGEHVGSPLQESAGESAPAPGPGLRELGVLRDEPAAPAPGPVDGSA